MSTTTTLYLIRHAQSHQSRETDNAEWPLSARGHEQAEALAPLLGPLGIESLYSSPYIRARQTVMPFAGQAGLGIEIHEGLRERRISHGLIDNFFEVWAQSWDDFEFALANCETSSDAQARFVAAVREIVDANQGQTLGIAAHGNVIGLFLNHLDPAFGRADADALQNPDLRKVVRRDGAYHWDRSFRVEALAKIWTDHRQTPID